MKLGETTREYSRDVIAVNYRRNIIHSIAGYAALFSENFASSLVTYHEITIVTVAATFLSGHRYVLEYVHPETCEQPLGRTSTNARYHPALLSATRQYYTMSLLARWHDWR
jgi:hypothetical protein